MVDNIIAGSGLAVINRNTAELQHSYNAEPGKQQTGETRTRIDVEK